MTINGSGNIIIFAKEADMSGTKLYFDIKDREYFDRLKDYIRINYGMYFEISEEKPSDGKYCIVSDYINRRNRKDVFLIKDKKGDVCKYEKASVICSELLKRIGVGDIAKPGESEPVIICVASASGGNGRTTISQAMCCSFASRGYRVLYINPDPLAVKDGIFREEKKNGFSMLRYYLGKNDTVDSSVIKTIASRDAVKRVDYIANRRPGADGFMTGSESCELKKALKGSEYDMLVMDMPSYPAEGHLDLMKSAGCNLVIKQEGLSQRHKAYKKYLESMGISITAEVVNFSEEGEYQIPEAEDIFNTMPIGFWNSIKQLCMLSEGVDG